MNISLSYWFNSMTCIAASVDVKLPGNGGLCHESILQILYTFNKVWDKNMTGSGLPKQEWNVEICVIHLNV